MTALSEAIEELYRAFGSYRVGNHVAGCPCCTTKEEEQRLAQRPLRSLTGDDLGGYAMSALYTWGTERDFKHFLPRLLQLFAEESIWTDAQSVYAKLPYTDWRRWPAAEQRAVETFTLAWFEDALSRPGAQARPEVILECAGLTGMDLSAYVARWEANQTPSATSHLAALVTSRAEHLARGQLPWIWWENDTQRVLPRWLLSGRALALLTSAFERAVDHPDASEWAQAHDILLCLSSAPME